MKVGHVEFYVGQMKYVTDDAVNIAVILGSCAGALVFTVIALVLVFFCCKSHGRCATRKKTNSADDERSAARNAVFLNAAQLPRIKQYRDTAIPRPPELDIRQANARGLYENRFIHHLPDEYITPIGKHARV